MSDTHCGHLVGLTPPGWQNKDWKTLSEKHAAIYAVQQQCWNFYESKVQQYGPYDVIIVNGDMIDGRGERSGSSELLVTNRDEQCDMATIAIRKAITKPKTKILMTYGTAYHTGDEEDWENKIANDVGAKTIESHIHPEIEGVIFDVKHHLSSSSVPHGRQTPIAKERVWSLIKAARGDAPKAQVIIRSHVHYFVFGGDRDYTGMSLPALQGCGTKFGTRRCSGTVDFGFVVFECEKGSWSWKAIIARQMEALSSKTIKV